MNFFFFCANRCNDDDEIIAITVWQIDFNLYSPVREKISHNWMVITFLLHKTLSIVNASNNWFLNTILIVRFIVFFQCHEIQNHPKGRIGVRISNDTATFMFFFLFVCLCVGKWFIFTHNYNRRNLTLFFTHNISPSKSKFNQKHSYHSQTRQFFVARK